MEILIDKGANLQYSDPFIPVFPKMRNYNLDLKSVTITKDVLKNTDCVLIATDHDQFDYDLISDHSDLVIDTRGRYKHNLSNVIRS